MSIIKPELRSVFWAMPWELLQRGRWWLIAALLGANALPVMILTALELNGPIDPEEPSQIVMHFVMSQVSMLICAAALMLAQGNPSRLFTFPISTAALVAWHLFPAMAIIALESAVSTAALNAIFQVRWPIWGPALFMAVALAAIDAVRWWLTDKSAWLPFGLALVALVLGCWYKSRYGPTFSQPDRWWRDVTAGEVATMLAMSGLAYYGAIIGVARNRRGDPLPSLGIIAWLERTFDVATKAGQSFRTPSHAQFWFEWRKKGGIMPATVVFGLLVGSCIWVIFIRDLDALFKGIVAGGAMLSVVGIIGGAIMGNCGPNDADFSMGNFLATRPITNAELAQTVLKTAAVSVVASWVIWAAAYLTLYFVLVASRLISLPAIPAELGWWYFPATILGCWIVVTCLASFGLTGRARPFCCLVCALLTLFIAWSLFSKYVLSRQVQAQFTQWFVAASGVTLVSGTAWAFFAACRRALIGIPTVVVACTVWLALSMFAVFELVLHVNQPLAIHIVVVIVGLLALAVAPLATAPLAVAWNRNR